MDKPSKTFVTGHREMVDSAIVRRPVVLDSRNILDPARARAAGFEHSGIGRP